MFAVTGLMRIEFLGHRRYPGTVERSAVQPKLKEGCNKRFTGIGAVLACFASSKAGPLSRLASADRQLLRKGRFRRVCSEGLQACSTADLKVCTTYKREITSPQQPEAQLDLARRRRRAGDLTRCWRQLSERGVRRCLEHVGDEIRR